MKFRFALIASLVPTAVFAAGGQSSDEPSGPASKLTMAMTLYAGGITLGKVDMDATIRGDDYHVVSNLETSGVVNAFWQAQIQATSNGKIEPKALKPALYDSFDTNHSGKRQEVSLTYENDQPVRMYANPKFPTSGYEVKPEQQKSTVDPLSAVMLITSGVGASADNPCAVTAPVFDGRRRYNVEISKVKDTQIKMDNGLYKGHALVCEIRYKQLAGFKPKIIKENESFPKINAWVATFPSAVAGRPYVIPLRVWADTQYGVVAAVATALKIDGVAPKSGS
ncbi:MAG TPA: DUF3108 domain-containing protein [Rhizomicrobium sp.]|nr:DUF3108 domain-containing protein [Rhizomicrobium sp.]